MPRKTKAKKPAKVVRAPRKRAIKRAVVTAPVEPVVHSPEPVTEVTANRKQLSIGVAVAVLIILAVTYLVSNKGVLVAAMVDGKPIFRWDLTNTMMSRYGKQTLENMVSERLINQAAAKQGVSVSADEVKAKENELIKSFGSNVTIDEVLKFQGITKNEFDEQIRMQILLTKLVGKGVTVSDKDIADYMEKNKESLPATDEATLKTEVKDAIYNQKIAEKIQPWFTDLKNKAKISRFIE